MQAHLRCQVKAWTIWLVAASFYSFEFFLRISPTVMVPDLLHAFAIDAAMVGNLSAFYYYAYATMQIPAGLLLDYVGIRPLLTTAAILVAAGSLLFAATHSFAVAIIGRILMGLGSAFSFIGCLKLAKNWFAESQFVIIVGLTNTLGVAGALWGEAPLAMMVNHWGWRETLWLAGIFGAGLAILIRMVIRDNPRQLGCVGKGNYQPLPQQLQHFYSGLQAVLRSPRTWLTAIYGGLMVAPISAFTELWSVPFFMQVQHFSRVHAAELSSLVFVGIAVGGPVNGWLSSVWQTRKRVMQGGCVGAIACFLALPGSAHFPIGLIILLLLLFGFFTSSMLLAFAINTEHHAAAISGLVIGFTNMLVMMGGTLFQPLVGYLLDRQQTAFTGAFNLPQYQHALLVLSICQVTAFILLFFIRETCERSATKY